MNHSMPVVCEALDWALEPTCLTGSCLSSSSSSSSLLCLARALLVLIAFLLPSILPLAPNHQPRLSTISASKALLAATDLRLRESPVNSSLLWFALALILLLGGSCRNTFLTFTVSSTCRSAASLHHSSPLSCPSAIHFNLIPLSLRGLCPVTDTALPRTSY
jgi:hypothetical protein